MSNLRLIVGSKGYPLGGSRAEPWPCFLPWFPGLETDMRSLPYAGPAIGYRGKPEPCVTQPSGAAHGTW
jgi:hypothetical protein